MSAWQQWLQHPERSRIRNAVFQIHLWMGAMGAVYILLMSITGSVLVYRNELSKRFSILWLVSLHENLLAGPERPPGKRYRRNLPDFALFNGSNHLVAGCEELASQLDRELGSALCADQLGPA